MPAVTSALILEPPKVYHYFHCFPIYLPWSDAGIKIAGRNINNLRHADDTTLMAESEEELKSLLMKVKEESGKSWLKTQHSKNEDHGIRSHHFLANRWGNSGNNDRLLSGASTGVPTHDKGHAERPDMQRRVRTRGAPPGPAWASTPKPESVCFTILRFSPTPLTLTGGYPRPPFSEGNQLRALAN